jgi:hypothetical protein
MSIEPQTELQVSSSFHALTKDRRQKAVDLIQPIDEFSAFVRGVRIALQVPEMTSHNRD